MRILVLAPALTYPNHSPASFWSSIKPQGVVTPICTVRPGMLTLYTKEGGGVALLSSVYYWVKGQKVRTVNSHRLISSTVRSHFAVRSSGQAVKVTVKNFLTPVLTVNVVHMGVTTP